MKHEGFGGISSEGGQVFLCHFVGGFCFASGFPAWDVPSATQRSHFRQNPVVWPRKRRVGGWQDFFFPIILVQWKTGWWFQLLWKILVKIGNLPPGRGEHKKCVKPPPRSWFSGKCQDYWKGNIHIWRYKGFFEIRKTNFPEMKRCKDVKQISCFPKYDWCFLLWGEKGVTVTGAKTF